MYSLHDQIETLKRKHQELQVQLEQEARQKNPDQMIIAEIKRKKLKIKDTIEELTRNAG